MLDICITGCTLPKKKTRPGGGKTAPAAFNLRRGQVDPGRETPRTPALDLGSGATFLGPLPNGRAQADNSAHWVWCHVLGTVTHRAGPRLTTQPKSSRAQRGGFFFPQAGEIRPGGGSNPPPAGAAGCAQTD